MSQSADVHEAAPNGLMVICTALQFYTFQDLFVTQLRRIPEKAVRIASQDIVGLQVLQMRPGHAARMRQQAPQPAAGMLPALVPSHGRRVTCALIGANEPVSRCSRSSPKWLDGYLHGLTVLYLSGLICYTAPSHTRKSRADSQPDERSYTRPPSQ